MAITIVLNDDIKTVTYNSNDVTQVYYNTVKVWPSLNEMQKKIIDYNYQYQVYNYDELIYECPLADLFYVDKVHTSMGDVTIEWRNDYEELHCKYINPAPAAIETEGSFESNMGIVLYELIGKTIADFRFKARYKKSTVDTCECTIELGVNSTRHYLDTVKATAAAGEMTVATAYGTITHGIKNDYTQYYATMVFGSGYTEAGAVKNDAGNYVLTKTIDMESLLGGNHSVYFYPSLDFSDVATSTAYLKIMYPDGYTYTKRISELTQESTSFSYGEYSGTIRWTTTLFNVDYRITGSSVGHGSSRPRQTAIEQGAIIIVSST